MLQLLARIENDYARRGMVVDKIGETWRVLWFDNSQIEDLNETIPYTILT